MTQNFLQKLYHKDLKKAHVNFDGTILDNKVSSIPDLQIYFENLSKRTKPGTKVLISYHNPSWEPILSLASKFGLRKKVGIQNWLGGHDLENILNLSGYKVLKTEKRFFRLTMITVAEYQITNHRNQTNYNKQYTVSIIIPARNEEGNIAKIIPSIPKFGKSQEFIFVEGGSTDHTWSAITNLQVSIYKQFTNSKRTLKVLKQKGHGKADAVWQGLKAATGDILMIYDADRTVSANDLPKFFEALVSKKGKFANGNRLIYPMEHDAMQFLNKIGNRLFSYLFTKILKQRFGDTLCGTKAFWAKDFKKFKRSKNDPFGDFDLIFGAIRNNLKVVEIPVRYKERVYGKTNINRFYHGLLLFKMAYLAYKEFKT